MVGMDLDVQFTLHRWQIENAGRARLFPRRADLSAGARGSRHTSEMAEIHHEPPRPIG
jgi:hypothetical protein